jgi:hypothetical protein
MRRRPRTGTLAFGVRLASRGGAAAIGFVLAAAGALGSAAAAFVLRGVAAKGGRPSDALPVVASSAIAWGAGATLAFAASLRAFPRDKEEGLVALLRARGIGPSEYVWGRTAGLSLVLAGAVGGGTLVACLAFLWALGPSGSALRTTAGALAYAVAFALAVAPLALATLGGRSRPRGYLTFVAVLALPELLEPWTRPLVRWRELTSIEAALTAVRAGVRSPVAHGPELFRALALLCALAALSYVLTLARVRRDAFDIKEAP